MTTPLFEPKPLPQLTINGTEMTYPVQRIFCVGRSYEAHAHEMGYEADRGAPFYFTKSAFTVVHSGQSAPYAPGTENLNYEMELVVALKEPVFKATPQEAKAAIYAYGCGLDMTRRDLQLSYREIRRPWCMGKDFENAAVLAPLTPASAYTPLGDAVIQLDVNGETRQKSTLDLLIWTVPEMISHLSYMYHLGAGDLIMTGTPEGVGPVNPGDTLSGSITGLSDLSFKIDPPADS